MDMPEGLKQKKMDGYAALSRLQSLADALLALRLESDLLSEDYEKSELRICKPGEADPVIAVYETLRDEPEDGDEAPKISGFVLRLYRSEGEPAEDALWTGEGELIASRKEKPAFDAEDTAAWIQAQID